MMPEIAIGTSTVYVNFTADINPNTTESLLATMSMLIQKKVETVHLLLSTPGGSVMHGLTLYNFLKKPPFELVTHNIGNVDSIGNAIFLAGQKRYATQVSTFMFHGVGFNQNGGIRFEEKNLREMLNSILSDQKRIGDIISLNTTIEQTEIEMLFREAQTKDVTYAVEKGIVNEIRDVEIPFGSPIISLVFQR